MVSPHRCTLEVKPSALGSRAQVKSYPSSSASPVTRAGWGVSGHQVSGGEVLEDHRSTGLRSPELAALSVPLTVPTQGSLQ